MFEKAEMPTGAAYMGKDTESVELYNCKGCLEINLNGEGEHQKEGPIHICRVAEFVKFLIAFCVDNNLIQDD